MAALPAPAPLPLPLLSLGGPRVAVAVGIVTAVFLFAAAVWCVQSWSGAVVKRRSAGRSSVNPPVAGRVGHATRQGGNSGGWLHADSCRVCVCQSCANPTCHSRIRLAVVVAARVGRQFGWLRSAGSRGHAGRGKVPQKRENRERARENKEKKKKRRAEGDGRWQRDERGRTQSGGEQTERRVRCTYRLRALATDGHRGALLQRGRPIAIDPLAADQRHRDQLESHRQGMMREERHKGSANR